MEPHQPRCGHWMEWSAVIIRYLTVPETTVMYFQKPPIQIGQGDDFTCSAKRNNKDMWVTLKLPLTLSQSPGPPPYFSSLGVTSDPR